MGGPHRRDRRTIPRRTSSERTLAQRGPHALRLRHQRRRRANAASKKAAETLADWGPNVRARFKVVADTDVTSEMMAARQPGPRRHAKVNQIVAGIDSELPIRQDDAGTKAGGKRVAGAGASFRLDYPNPVAPGRLVRVFSASTTAGFERLVSDGAGQRLLRPTPTTWSSTRTARSRSRACSATT